MTEGEHPCFCQAVKAAEVHRCYGDGCQETCPVRLGGCIVGRERSPVGGLLGFPPAAYGTLDFHLRHADHPIPSYGIRDHQIPPTAFPQRIASYVTRIIRSSVTESPVTRYEPSDSNHGFPSQDCQVLPSHVGIHRNSHMRTNGYPPAAFPGSTLRVSSRV